MFCLTLAHSLLYAFYIPVYLPTRIIQLPLTKLPVTLLHCLIPGLAGVHFQPHCMKSSSKLPLSLHIFVLVTLLNTLQFLPLSTLVVCHPLSLFFHTIPQSPPPPYKHGNSWSHSLAHHTPFISPNI